MGLTVGSGGSTGVSGTGTLNSIPLWTGTTSIGDSALRQSGSAIIVGATDPKPTAAETFRTIGGIISDTGLNDGNVVLGEAVVCQSVDNTRSVVIGYQARNDNSGGGGSATNATLNVVIGPNTSTNNGLTQGVGNCVFVGANIVFSGTAPTGNVVAIGADIALNNAATGPLVGTGALGRGQGVAFGNGAGAQGAFNNWVCVGHSANINAANAMAIGDGSQSSFTSSIALGRNAATDKANQLAIGGANLAITEVLIGEGLLSGAGFAGLTIRPSDSQGTNQASGNFLIRGSMGTGNAASGGDIYFQTGLRVASGVNGQTPTTILTLAGGTPNVAIFGAGSFGSGERVVFIGNVTTAPTTNPAGGGLLYVNAGALTYRGSGGTVTVLGPA